MLIFDFETYDPEIQLRGPGAVLGRCQIIGMGYVELSKERLTGSLEIGPDDILYTTNIDEMAAVLQRNSTWVCHNVGYEISIAKYILGIEFKEKNIFCTKVGGYLYNSSLLQTSLEYQGKLYLHMEKDRDRLGREAILKAPELCDIPKSYLKLEPGPKKDEQLQKIIKKTTAKVISNLHIFEPLFPDLVMEYCKNDVLLTALLHKKWLAEIDETLYNRFSEINKVLIEMKRRGVKIDEHKISKAIAKIDAKLEENFSILAETETGKNLNIRSSKQLAALMDELEIKYGVTEKDNPNITSKFLKSSGNRIAMAVAEAKKLMKVKEDFLESLSELAINGRIHGNMSLFGAAMTGRFSHSKPNLAQIPARDPETGPLMRDIFIPDDGKKWISLDFKSQEPRLIVHYALKCQEAKVQRPIFKYDIKTRSFTVSCFVEFKFPDLALLKQEYIENPDLDNYARLTEVIKATTGVEITRSETKTIALGKSYGMGLTKLSQSLKIDETKAKILSNAFNAGAPYLQALDDYCRYRAEKTKKIKTISGRMLTITDDVRKSLNKLIQGSAADQTALCLLEMYKHGIIPQIVVHDEINFSGTEEEAQIVKSIMENTIKLEIPIVADMGIGQSWAEAKHMEVVW